MTWQMAPELAHSTAAQLEREMNRDMAEGARQHAASERGRAALGFVQKRSDLYAGLAWVRTNTLVVTPPDFPTKYAQEALSAYAIEQAATQQLAAARLRVEQWIDQHSPSPGLASLKMEEATIELRNRLQTARQATETAIARFGQALLSWEGAKRTLAFLDQRRMQAEMRHLAAMSEIEQDEQRARTVLSALQ